MWDTGMPDYLYSEPEAISPAGQQEAMSHRGDERSRPRHVPAPDDQPEYRNHETNHTWQHDSPPDRIRARRGRPFAARPRLFEPLRRAHARPSASGTGATTRRPLTAFGRGPWGNAAQPVPPGFIVHRQPPGASRALRYVTRRVFAQCGLAFRYQPPSQQTCPLSRPAVAARGSRFRRGDGLRARACRRDCQSAQPESRRTVQDREKTRWPAHPGVYREQPRRSDRCPEPCRDREDCHRWRRAGAAGDRHPSQTLTQAGFSAADIVKITGYGGARRRWAH